MKKNYIRSITQKDVVTVILNKPDKLNLIDYDFLLSFYEKLTELDRNDAIKIILLKSLHKTFSIGIDWKKLINSASPKTKDFFNLSIKFIDLLMQTNKITIAQIDGKAYGEGLGLTLACDFKIISESSLLGVPQISYGFIPIFSTIPLLITQIGKTYANELIYTGEIINGLRAEQIGLVNLAVRRENLNEETNKFINKLFSQKGGNILQYKNILKKIDPIKQVPVDQLFLANFLKISSDKKKLKKFDLFLKSV